MRRYIGPLRRNIWLIALLALVVAIGLGGAIALSLKGGGGFKYPEEWVRALLQVGLIAVLGIVTSSVLERFKDTLQQRRDDSKLRFNVLAELTRAYSDVKLLRRKLQKSNDFTVKAADRLNEIQVIVEIHKRTSVFLFKERGKLQDELILMEKYLNKVANKADSPERDGFCSAGFDAFSDSYARAIELILNEIAALRPDHSTVADAR